MKISIAACLLALLVSCAVRPADRPYDIASNVLTATEKKAGWKLLFDGDTLNGWRSYGKPDGPKEGWIVENGILICVENGHGGDIVTVDQFTDFDLQWDWRVPTEANSGIKYMVDEKRPSAPGHEYQMIDDKIVANSPLQTTASFYDVLAPGPNKKLKQRGWNHSRVLVKGNHVEHWLNGQNVLTYELASPELKAAIAKSKFKDAPGFGDKITGPILLTEHHDEALFKNIKIRELKTGQ